MNIKKFKRIDSKKVKNMIDYIDSMMECYDIVLADSPNSKHIQELSEHKEFVLNMKQNKKLLKWLEQSVETKKHTPLPIPEII
jgi:oligoribonuclease NrnB/cAMP/cGMP phosphodiesterase (DHH superfamily)